ncbi:CDP-alcohol phosphatidyltransferase family protein [Campylobacter sp. CCUG 57310]|uniref:CDP-alcohol phosphatidyltransferase family protein n=1 Tax=Campylobacter sp. CCUG 57310 TaxID=2517362 RepID=UPI001566BB3B|nr:CDP-alcohol phosphatidyltransferase family protein [Campylobacter sp. CCUG 57310]QKF91349.1 CDP-OH_P_transf domain-containing protein [Campylobacter sp. CCUG 57310]
MTIYELKPKFQNLLRPLTTKLFNLGITANQVTFFACIVSVFIGFLLVKFSHISALFFILPIWLFLRMALNAIDGILAREFNQKSALGGYLNEATDVISDSALYLPFAFIAPFDWGTIMLIIFLSQLSEFLGVLGQVLGRNRRYDGPMGKSDRAFAFGLFGMLYACFGELWQWVYYLGVLIIVLLVITCINRVKSGLKEA